MKLVINNQPVLRVCMWNEDQRKLQVLFPLVIGCYHRPQNKYQFRNVLNFKCAPLAEKFASRSGQHTDGGCQCSHLPGGDHWFSEEKWWEWWRCIYICSLLTIFCERSLSRAHYGRENLRMLRLRESLEKSHLLWLWSHLYILTPASFKTCICSKASTVFFGVTVQSVLGIVKIQVSLKIGAIALCKCPSLCGPTDGLLETCPLT